MFLSNKVWVVGLTIAVIASLETLLNIEAVDKIDPHKRYTPPNRELFAQGVGNIAAGLMGGIPVTSVIVRSSVNIQSDNASKLSTILHGVFMLISILALSPVMNMIPLSALASILIITGFKLTKPKLYIDLLKKGPAQFVPFIVTILAIIFTDLLIGVVVGLLVSIIFLLISNVRNPLSRELNKLHIGEVIRFDLPNQVSFLNKATIKETLWSIPGGSKVLIDASGCEYIDDDIMELIEDFKSVVAGEKNIKLNIIGLKEKYSIKDQIEFTNVLDSKTQQRLTPEDVLNLLKSGNERFTSGKGSDKYHIHHVQAASEQQNPMAVLLGCIDSRTSPEVLFDAGIGDLLTIRIAGNIVNPEIVGSLEIAVKKLGARLIVVKGHSLCGAVALSLKNVMDENIQTVTSKIQGVASACGNYPLQDNSDFQTTVEEVCKANTLNSVKEILKMSPYLKKKIESKEIGLVSAYHDITSGIVKFDPLI
jgi:carbonic anhydrase